MAKKSKTLQDDSKYAHLDTDGDGIVSDEEMAQADKIMDLEATGALSVAKGQTSLGAFVNQLGAAGIAAYAVSIGGIIATIVSARKKAKQQIQALSNQSLGVGGGVSTPSVQAPSFNVVGATQTSQLAQTIAGAEDKPLRAYVVASDVSTAQELERSTIEGASIG